MIDIFSIHIKLTRCSDYCKYLPYISEDSRNLFNKYNNNLYAVQSLVGDIIIRLLVIKHLGLKNDMIKIDKDYYSKPFLSGYNDCHFNISHSEKWVVCAIDKQAIGIDIEFVRPIDLKICKRILTRDEYEKTSNLEKQQRLSYFYKLWTLKESYIKAVGKGFLIPLNSISFIINNQEEIDYQGLRSNVRYFFKLYNYKDNYQIAVCAKNKRFPTEIRELKWDNILTLLKS